MIQILKDSFHFYKLNLKKIFIVLLPIFIPHYLIVCSINYFNILDESSFFFEFFLFCINIISSVIYTSSLIYLFYAILSKNYISAKECLLKGLMMTPLVLLLDGIVVLISVLGLLLFIIPGIFILPSLHQLPPPSS